MVDYGPYVETCYPAGSSSPSSGDPGGAQAELQITAGPSASSTLSYELRIPVGFTWVLGGKLPGLCGGACWTGSNNGAGGWSARFMWRAGGAAEVLLSDATTTGDGTDLGRGSWDWLADGQFHLLTETVTLNTDGAANGIIVVTYNGLQVANLTGITFNTASEPEPISGLMFTTFFGGDNSSWAPTSVQHIDFADFRVG
ncbi:MAG: polysaccharide lyase [Candidatus Dormiibacterota bacterium]